MKPTWLIETGVWEDDNVSRMIAILLGMGVHVQAEPYHYLCGSEFDVPNPDSPVIFFGSLNTAEYLQIARKEWVPLIWYDADVFRCQTYYAHWGQFLLQQRYGFYPLAELLRLKDQLYSAFGTDDMIFIRPHDNDKSFTGRLVPQENFPKWYEEALAGARDATRLVVVSTPVRVEAEWRFVIADRRVIAGSGYRWAGKRKLSGEDERAAARFAEEVAEQPWQPRPIYCMDIALTAAEHYRVVEIGGINSAGLYHCELLPVIEAMNLIAERDFRRWRGR
jgi:hypothetical protein